MISEQPPGRNQSKPLLAILGIFTICAGVSALIFSGYWLNWTWTGFLHKTLWDWMQLLSVPAALAASALLFYLALSRNEQKTAQRRDQTERDIASDNQREVLLRGYFSQLSELLLGNQLRLSDPYSEERYLARAQTMTILPRLDATRKRSLLLFLYESKLVNTEGVASIVQLKGADLNRVDLHKANLRGVDLSGADLSKADLSKADLSKADLSKARLSGADLRGADLRGADLREADLREAQLSKADLSKANLSEVNLSGANLSSVNLSEANLSGTQLSKANLSGANLSQANLFCARLSEANLSEANLSEANLSGTLQLHLFGGNLP
jgi:uncharacterized protein YjbI with pentapeptide repeats